MLPSNGRVLLCLGAGLEKSQFKRSILQTLARLLSGSEPTNDSVNHSTAESVVSSGTTLAEHDEASTADESQNPGSTSITQAVASAPDSSVTSAETSSAGSTMPPSVSTRVQDMLAERRERLERIKKDQEAAEKAERKAKAEARRHATDAEPSAAQGQQAIYAQTQRKKKQEAKSERERILKDIENNRTERKEREELRKALAKTESEAHDGAGGLVHNQPMREVSQSQPRTSQECAIQVRLFDGSTIRGKFPTSQNLSATVRPWINEQLLDPGTPYTFKQILTPEPNRTISRDEEEASLLSLGLTPSATLVMVPIQGHFVAYPRDQSIFARTISTMYQFLTLMANIVIHFLRSLLGIRQPGTAQSHASSATAPGGRPSEPRSTVDPGPRMKVRTLRDQREDPDNHQFYNGNQLNFEPNKDNNDRED